MKCVKQPKTEDSGDYGPPNELVTGWTKSNHTTVINGDPREKFDPSRPAFQGHSRLLELTRIDRLPMTSH